MQSLADRAGIELPKQEMSAAQREAADRRSRLLEINKVAAKYFYMLLRSPQGAHALQYFEERKLSKETMQHFGLGYSNKYSDDLYQYLKKQGYEMNCLRTVVWLPLMNAGVVMTNSGTERCFQSWMQITGSSDLGVVSWARENRNI